MSNFYDINFIGYIFKGPDNDYYECIAHNGRKCGIFKNLKTNEEYLWRREDIWEDYELISDFSNFSS